MKSGSRNLSRLIVTPGEPAGIGPDIVIKHASQVNSPNLVIVADPDLMLQRSKTLGIQIEIKEFSESKESAPGQLNVVPVPLKAKSTPGSPNPDNAAYVLECLSLATDLCLEGTVAGVVTGPVQKSTINESGIPFSGHTEWFAERTGADRVVMMLAADDLRVALATTHLPLRDVADAITEPLLISVIKVLNTDLQEKFGILSPRILVCGLNPHAGENGYLGREEKDIIDPVLNRLKNEGLNLSGPLPADTLFTPKYLEDADAILAMYHDQGLPVIKHLGFGACANITLGLPIIRTSVDHGTALELAGTGDIDCGSLSYAIKAAEQMAEVISD